MKKNTKVNKITREQKEIIYSLMDFFMRRNPLENPADDCGDIIKLLDDVWGLNGVSLTTALGWTEKKLKKLGE